MIPRLFTHKLLSPSDLEPSDPRMRVVGVFNPGVVEVEGRTAILARVVEQPIEIRDGFLPSPHYSNGELIIDWLDWQGADLSDPRTIVSKSGIVRLRFVSHLRLFWSEDGKSAPCESLRVLPTEPYEEYGIEDPRITLVDDQYRITYVGVSRWGICTSLLSARDFVMMEKHGIILPPDNKDALLFPWKIGSRYRMLHRPMTSMRFLPPRVWVASSDDLLNWGAHRPVAGVSMVGAFRDRSGGSTPPIFTERGWLVLVHGSDKRWGEEGAGQYSAGAVLLNREHPEIVVARTPEPFMFPEQDFEKRGFVDNVVFPTGAVVRDGRLDVYYGAADEHVGVCGFDLNTLLDACEPV